MDKPKYGNYVALETFNKVQMRLEKTRAAEFPVRYQDWINGYKELETKTKKLNSEKPPFPLPEMEVFTREKKSDPALQFTLPKTSAAHVGWLAKQPGYKLDICPGKRFAYKTKIEDLEMMYFSQW